MRVTLGTFQDALPGSAALTVQTADPSSVPGTYTYSGGAIRAERFTQKGSPKNYDRLVCPNDDVVVITLTRPPDAVTWTPGPLPAAPHGPRSLGGAKASAESRRGSSETIQRGGPNGRPCPHHPGCASSATLARLRSSATHQHVRHAPLAQHRVEGGELVRNQRLEASLEFRPPVRRGPPRELNVGPSAGRRTRRWIVPANPIRAFRSRFQRSSPSCPVPVCRRSKNSPSISLNRSSSSLAGSRIDSRSSHLAASRAVAQTAELDPDPLDLVDEVRGPIRSVVEIRQHRHLCLNVLDRPRRVRILEHPQLSASAPSRPP